MERIPTIEDPRGNLSFIQSGPGGACPFEIGTVAWDGREGAMTVPVPGTDAVLALSPARDPLEIPAAQDVYADAHAPSRTSDCRIIALPRRAVANGSGLLPFEVARVFYIHGIPAGAERGGHSHHQDQELIIALRGSFNVCVDDGAGSVRSFRLDRADRGLYVPAGLWRTLDGFSDGAVCLTLITNRFSEADYVRGYDDFLTLTSRKKQCRP